MLSSMKEIEDLRRRMIVLAAKHGLNHPKVLKVSSELDLMIVHYQKCICK